MSETGRRGQRVFTIAPGAPFLASLAAALCDGVLVDGFRYRPQDPLSLAGATIFVPTRRSARVLRSEFVTLLGAQAAILPQIRPLGEDDDIGLFDLAAPEEADLAQPIGGVSRLIELGRLVLAWRNRLPQVVLDAHHHTPLVAPASPADALWLARALAELIDSVEIEERDWADLAKIDSGEHALWWQLAVEFLSIASRFWPARLEELRRASPVRHRNAILRGEARRVAAGRHSGPVIVAGSTGSIPAAGDLILAVARLEQGAVVLPGLDLAMPDNQWALLHGLDKDGRPEASSRSHPQFALARLLDRLGLDRDDIQPLGTVPEALRLRAATISQALAPAEATDGWNAWRAASDGGSLSDAFADVTLIEAANEREEASAIAIALRLALEQPGRSGEAQAALITPDRGLARRVAAELGRFGIHADDSAGQGLAETPQGVLTQLALEAVLRPGDPVAIVSLLKHPLLRLGMDADTVTAAAEALELLALRGGLGAPDIAELEPLLDARLSEHESDRYPPQYRQSLPKDAARGARQLARKLSAAVEPLAGAFIAYGRDEKRLTLRLTLADWASRSARMLEALTVDARGDLSGLWGGETGEALLKLFAAIIETDGQIEADGPQWIDAFAALAAGEAVKPQALSHPRVFIFGTLEARLQAVDTVILGGLNEGSWPGQTVNNPFLSRSMKRDIGLEPPETRIGQQAHDFEVACGNRRLILSRAARQGTAPTVASRWLQRLLALGGRDFADRLKQRGEAYRRFAGAIDIGASQPAAERPAPKVSPDLQPKRYSFSEVAVLRRDPYAIYARRILRLDPVLPFNSDPGAAEKGTLYHAIIEQYTRARVAAGAAAGSPASAEIMAGVTKAVFDEAGLPAAIDRVWRARFAEVGNAFRDWEAERSDDVRRTLTEAGASFELPAAGILLTGHADRIDILGAGLADIIDYKTGISPSRKQAQALLDPQLALEAAVLAAGGFAGVDPVEPYRLIYVRLRPGDRFYTETVNEEDKAGEGKSTAELAREAVAQLSGLVNRLRGGSIGFASRVIPASQQDFGGDYDHLARVAEWSTADREGESDG